MEPIGDSAAAAPAGLHRQLSPFGVWLLALSCLSPVLSIYGVGGDVLVHAGTGTALLFLLGLAAALLWGFVYAELGSAFPYAGGDYVGVGRTLGGWAGAATLTLWVVTTGPAIAFECQIAATYAKELVPGMTPMLLTFVVLAAATVVALLAVKTSTFVTGIFLGIEMIAVVTLIACGFWHPLRGTEVLLAAPHTFSSSGAMVPVALGILMSALVNTAYGTVGGNQAIYFGEELRDPHRKMGKVIIAAAMTGGFATALPVIAVVVGARDLNAVLASPAPFATFVSQAIAPWAAQALSAGVVLAIFNATIATIMVGARLLFSVARDGLLPGAVNRLLSSPSASGVPRAATVVMAVFSALCCLLTSHLLLAFMSGLIVYGWGMVCLAVLVGRYKGLTGGPGLWRAPLYPLAPVLGLLMAAGFAVANLADASAGRPSLIILGVLMAAAVGWYYLVPKKRGWQPSMSDVTAAPP